jgi:hypothetical protein
MNHDLAGPTRRWIPTMFGRTSIYVYECRSCGESVNEDSLWSVEYEECEPQKTSGDPALPGSPLAARIRPSAEKGSEGDPTSS